MNGGASILASSLFSISTGIALLLRNVDVNEMNHLYFAVWENGFVIDDLLLSIVASKCKRKDESRFRSTIDGSFRLLVLSNRWIYNEWKDERLSRRVKQKSRGRKRNERNESTKKRKRRTDLINCSRFKERRVKKNDRQLFDEEKRSSSSMFRWVKTLFFAKRIDLNEVFVNFDRRNYFEVFVEQVRFLLEFVVVRLRPAVFGPFDSSFSLIKRTFVVYQWWTNLPDDVRLK